MTDRPTTPSSYSRRDALRAVGKYSLALTGASVVALSAEEAAAQAACSRPNAPWWCNGGGNGNGNGGGNGNGNGGGNGGGRGNGRGNAGGNGNGNAFGLGQDLETNPKYDLKGFETPD